MKLGWYFLRRVDIKEQGVHMSIPANVKHHDWHRRKELDLKCLINHENFMLHQHFRAKPAVLYQLQESLGSIHPNTFLLEDKKF